MIEGVWKIEERSGSVTNESQKLTVLMLLV